MTNPVLVEVIRGSVVESVHRGSVAVFDAGGKAVMGRLDAVNLFDLEQRLARMELDLVAGAERLQHVRRLQARRGARRTG